MKIRRLRQQLGLTQVELAQCLGVKQATVSMWEVGEGYPTVKNMKKLACVLNCTMDELIDHSKGGSQKFVGPT